MRLVSPHAVLCGCRSHLSTPQATSSMPSL
jgi:hypothetical protein